MEWQAGVDLQVRRRDRALQRIGARACFDSFFVDAPTGLRTTELSKSGYIGNSRSADEMVPSFPGKHAGGIRTEV